MQGSRKNAKGSVIQLHSGERFSRDNISCMFAPGNMMNLITNTLDELAVAIRRCRKCRLYSKRLHAVPGEGTPDADVMLVGEAPGAVEDRTGRPFMGPAGKFLNQLFTENEIRRSAVFLTSCVKCRPPENRNPRSRELDTCATTWLLPQIDRI